MESKRQSDYQRSYDLVADEYARRIFDELKHKPLDRQWLDRFASLVRGAGLVCDLGCGPGQIARYLSDLGVPVIGMDLSPAMIEQARRLSPAIDFRSGDMAALDVPNDAWAGIAAFYSIIHIERPRLGGVLREFHRVLKPEGRLLLAFHVGEETVHLEEWWGRRVDVDFFFFRSQEMIEGLLSAGFEIEEAIEREPYPEVEHPSRRAYIFARKRPSVDAKG